MTRILQIIDHLGPGGAQTALLNLLKYRDVGSFHHTVACLHGRGEMAAEFESFGVLVVSLSPCKWPPHYFLSLWRLLRRERFDIIHCHLFGANWLAKPLAWLAGQRVIFNHDQCNDAFRHGIFLLVDRLTNLLSTKILAVSHSTVRTLVEEEKIAPGLVEYFPNGVDLSAFSLPLPAARAAARARWNLPADALLVGGVGRLVSQKDFATFLEAAVLVRAKIPQAHFVIFGQGPEERMLKRQSASLGLQAAVTFAGYVPERTAIYAALDLLLLTSRYEGTPLVLLEAMASGVPIAATAVDGSAEILRDGASALLFPPQDASATAQAVIRLLLDAAERKQFADAARRTAEDDYSAEALMQKLEALYRHCCERS